MLNFKLRKGSLLFFLVLMFMLHLPFAFSKSKELVVGSISKDNASIKNEAAKNATAIFKMYDSLQLDERGLSSDAFEYAVKGYEYLKSAGKIINDNVLSIVDFTKPSNEKRLFVIDLRNYQVLFNTYVAHGQNSGKEFANHFSNRPESFESSLGFYITADTYIGKNGFSLHLNGIEHGINDKADERAIVMHGAPYVSENFIKQNGYLGRSWGCPAVPVALSRPIIESIKNGSCLFIYGADKKYLNNSRIINS